ncbi:MAG: preprotein translocase subunit SecA [Clostridia bacterium]|nr:preprotein translocase subunit SecA [Clostridia bacterium]
MSIVEKVFGTYSERELKKVRPVADAVMALENKYRAMSDSELSSMTSVLKGRLSGGETLDDILPDAFATVREAAARVLGKRAFYTQVIGGILLHQGRIAEMKTGEGKTLAATMPAYLNALEGNGVHIVTVNDYLARRDSEENGKVYGFLGMTTGLIVHEQSVADKVSAYNSDITYGTNNEIGFDYLRDNMVPDKAHLVQRPFNFAIVDEVDSILIDEARTPLIISGMGEKSDDLYNKANSFVRSLRALRIKEMDTKVEYDYVNEDYVVDEKAKRCTLTARGIDRAERFFGVENISDPENSDIMHHIDQALHAYGIMQRDVDYLVTPDKKVLIIDAFTGRVMPGRRFSNGLHQAIEAKEGVKIQQENQTLATITFQNLFRLYKKLSGMTGTALTEDDEFREIYGIDVVEVPTNLPMIRVDDCDIVYKTEAAKFRAVIARIKFCHEKGQPVLVGTVSVDKSERLSSLLKREGIKHNVLNAKYHEKEAEIIAQAGKYGAVTISTNMAGRGTDIMLGGNAEFMAKADLRGAGYNDEEIYLATGVTDPQNDRIAQARSLYTESLNKHRAEIAPEAEKVRAAGGLMIIGTERHESRRIDNQLRGRSGRQGDPGESVFYLSLEDDLMRLFGGDRLYMMVDRIGLDEDQEINAKILSNSIESAQKRIEGDNFGRRKTVLEYDDVMNQQRNIIYSQRRQVIDGDDISEMIESSMQAIAPMAVEACLDENGKVNTDSLRENLYWLIDKSESFDNESPDKVIDIIYNRIKLVYAHQCEVFGDSVDGLKRAAILRAVDTNWMQHLDAMDDLREGVGLSSYAQRKPINEYRNMGGEMFDEMIGKIKEDAVRLLLCARPADESRMRKAAQIRINEAKKAGADEKARPIVRKSSEKVGRNDPCPCGSGLKYKKCCGANIDIRD